MTKEQDNKREADYSRDVLAHIAAHEAKGETDAVEAHMESPRHKAIVEAAAATATDELHDVAEGLPVED